MVVMPLKKSQIIIFFNMDNSIEGTCEKFQEIRILCCHYVRVHNIECVDHNAEKYILNRWTRTAKSNSNEEITKEEQNSKTVLICRLQMKSKINALLDASDNNTKQEKFVNTYMNIQRKQLKQKLDAFAFLIVKLKHKLQQ